ncbi:MAG: flagellar motor switch protein FliG [Anaerolineae bacterium]
MATAELELRGTEKAAILLIALGSDLASSVLKHCTESEVERLTLAIFNTQSVPSTIRDAVLDECLQLTRGSMALAEGGEEYARELLTRTYGNQQAIEFLERISGKSLDRPFEFLDSVDPAQLASSLANEHPQTVALVLCYLPPKKVAAVMANLSEELQAEVSTRIAMMDRISPDIVSDVQSGLRRKMASFLAREYSSVGGVNFLVRILNQSDRTTERAILENLEQYDTALADSVRRNMFVFEDIVQLDDRSIQRVLRDVESRDLVLALKGSNEEVRAAVFRNLSSRAAETMREDLDAMGPVRLRNVEEAQQRIVNLIRKLEEAEEIVVSRGSQDELIV